MERGEADSVSTEEDRFQEQRREETDDRQPRGMLSDRVDSRGQRRPDLSHRK